MHISFDIDPIILAIAGISACFSIFYTLWYFFSYRSLKKASILSHKTNRLHKGDICDESQGVSVIVYSDNDTSKLVRNLPSLLEQDYPLYEIIVVNDGENEAVQDHIDRLALNYDNIHYTCTPNDARNLSRKKLALMVGIKAAKYDIILTTSAKCRPMSEQWISAMAAHFDNTTGVVIGISKTEDGIDVTKGRFLRAFMRLQNTVKYLIQAIRHKPYRGTSDNIAYRKTLFFKHKGFSHSMHLHYGDDDIFVNEITTKENTRVEISEESMVSVWYNNPDRAFKNDKLRHSFTESKISSPAFFMASLLTAFYYAIFIGSATMIALGYSNIIIIATALLIIALTIIPQIAIYRKIAALLQSAKLMMSIPLFTLAQPFINFYYKLKSKHHTDYNYTWQRLKG